MTAVECPSCGKEIKLFSNPKVGQQVVCKACDAELEVVWLEPLELDWYYEDDDFEDDDDFGLDDED